MQKLYILYGDNKNEIFNRILLIKDELSALGQLKVEKYHLAKLDDIEKFLKQDISLSLFPENMLYIVDINHKALKYIEKNIKDFISVVKQFLETKNIILSVGFDKLDREIKNNFLKSSLYSNLSEVSRVEEYVALKPWQTEQIKQKILSVASKYNLAFDRSALDFFVDIFKDNAGVLDQELKKLQIFLMPNNTVTEQLLRDLYFENSNIEDLFNALISKKTKGISFMLEQLLNNYPFLYLIAALQNKFRSALKMLLCIKQGMHSDQIAKSLGIHPYRVKKELMMLNDVSVDYMNKIVKQLSDIEYKVKSGLMLDRHALNILVLSVA